MSSNQILVWDRYSGNWIGTWEGDLVNVSSMFTYKDGELERAAIVSPDGIVYRILVDGCTDDDGTHPGMIFETAVDIGDQEAPASEAEITVDHHYGAWASWAESDGVGEVTPTNQVIPDASKYRSFGKEDYDMINDEDNQMDPHREDYATLVAPGDENNIPAGGFYVSTENGWWFGVRQAWVQRIRTRKPFKSITVRVESTRGWVAIRKIAARMRRKAFGRGRPT